MQTIGHCIVTDAMQRSYSVNRLLLTAVSLVAISTASPVLAQDADPDNDAVLQELAEMRAKMDAMASRIETLEGELKSARGEAAAATAVAAKAEATASESAAKASGTEVSWKGAPEIKGKGGWSFKPRGRLMYDAGVVSIPDSVNQIDGFGNEVRRARLGVEGGMPGGFGYKFELDFAGNGVDITDAYLSYKDGGLKIMVGQQNNFQGLEELTSSLNISHLERAAFTDAFDFERRVGIGADIKTGDVLLQGGLFTDNINDLSNKNWGGDARVVYMPKIGGAQLHFGASAHYADLEFGSTTRFRQRPAVHFTSLRFIDTGTLDAQSETGLGLEAAVIAGPFHATGEAYWQRVDRPGALVDPTFFGAYAEVGLFLTKGDSRGYKDGKFDRTKPKKAVGEGGIGAIQLNLRYDRLDLNDGGIVGGTQDGLLASLIWTPTDYTRFMVGYAHLMYSDAIYAAAGGDTSYSVDSLGVRAQIDF